jgi:hypothetical protein
MNKINKWYLKNFDGFQKNLKIVFEYLFIIDISKN